MHASPQHCQILLPVPFDQTYDYALPEGEPLPPLGSMVQVTFGRRAMVGVVWGFDAPTIAHEKIKPIGAVIAHIPPLTNDFRQFIDWMAAYTLQPRGSILDMALHTPALEPLPAKPRKSKAAKPLPNAITPDLSPDQQAATTTLTHAVKTRKFQPFLLDGVTGSGKTEVYFAAIEAALQQGGQVLVLLPEIGLTVQWLARFEARFGVTPLLWHSSVTPAQKRDTWRAVASPFAPPLRGGGLDVVESGGVNTAGVIPPRHCFAMPAPPHVSGHSLTAMAGGGKGSLVVGARSALFLPFADLRLIIVDEEHDGSYKQEEGVIYHARDMAVARAKHAACPVVLASATPSLETTINAREGRYQLLHLPDRHGGKMAPIRTIDMRQTKLSSNRFITPFLLEKIKTTLAKGEQAALFLNRRGYAPLVLCRACGHRFACTQCSSWMVMHEGGRDPRAESRVTPTLTCHHCHHTTPLPPCCPQCQTAGKLAPCGPGVERLEEEIHTLLPEVKVGVMTSDVLTTPKQLQTFIHAVEAQEIQLIIGTQMIAKGHHFPKLTLVGVVDADMGLNTADPRAAEHSFQLLHQVAGRAGREALAGEVWLQTTAPDHPVMQALLRQDREYFTQLETELRQSAGLPPFGRLAALVLSGVNEESVWHAARSLARAAPIQSDIQLLGPAAAQLYRLRGQIRVRFLLKSPRNVLLQPYLRRWLGACALPREIRVKMDVDPQQFG
jgi:primosomal protein N' (replication factor Y)